MRKEVFITIEKGRDQGKTFKITEMSASAIEKWAGQALLTIMKGNTDINVTELQQTSNTAALLTAVQGALFGLEWHAVQPLMDALLPQIRFVPDAAKPDLTMPLTPATVDAHIEDVGTLIRLRGEVLKLSLDFFIQGESFLSRLGAALAQPA